MSEPLILNRPECQLAECSQPAITLYLNKWLCGDCLMKAMKRVQEKQQEMAFNE